MQTNLSEYGVQSEIASLDSATQNLNTFNTNIIISSSYKGTPPDNANKFVTWPERLVGADKLKGVNSSVFGVGNSDGATTFHKIPIIVNKKFEQSCAQAVIPAEVTNVKHDLVGPFVEKLTGSSKALNDKPSSKGLTLRQRLSTRASGPKRWESVS